MGSQNYGKYRIEVLEIFRLKKILASVCIRNIRCFGEIFKQCENDSQKFYLENQIRPDRSTKNKKKKEEEVKPILNSVF